MGLGTRLGLASLQGGGRQPEAGYTKVAVDKGTVEGLEMRVRVRKLSYIRVRVRVRGLELALGWEGEPHLKLMFSLNVLLRDANPSHNSGPLVARRVGHVPAGEKGGTCSGWG